MPVIETITLRFTTPDKNLASKAVKWPRSAAVPDGQQASQAPVPMRGRFYPKFLIYSGN